MNANTYKFPKKRHSKAFVCVLFFSLSKRLFKDNVIKPHCMHLPYFYLLRGILRLRKELTGSGFKKMLKIMRKNMRGIIIKTVSFSFFIVYFTTFLIAHFFTFLQQITAGNLKVAGDSASHRRIFTTQLSPEERCPFNTGNRYLAFFWDQILCLLNGGVL